MKKHTLIRLFVESPLNPGITLNLCPEQAQYVIAVMRCKTGSTVQVFNGQDGEYRARLMVAKKTVTLHVELLLHAQVVEVGPHLYFAPIKRKRLEMLVEKATELGVTGLTPVMTQHATVREVNPARLRLISIEAAEQCERLTVPVLDPELSLQELLDTYAGPEPLLVCDERGGVDLCPILQVTNASRRSLLIGPEGGFSEREFDAMKRSGKVLFVSLGPRILRAETAAIVGVSALTLNGFQATCSNALASEQ